MILHPSPPSEKDGVISIFYSYRSQDRATMFRDFSDTLLDFCQAAVATDIQKKALVSVAVVPAGFTLSYTDWARATDIQRSVTEGWADAAAVEDFAGTYIGPGAWFTYIVARDVVVKALVPIGNTLINTLQALPKLPKALGDLIAGMPKWLPWAVVGLGAVWIVAATLPKVVKEAK